MFYRPETPGQKALRIHENDPEAVAWRRASQDVAAQAQAEIMALFAAGPVTAADAVALSDRLNQDRERQVNELLAQRGIDWAAYLARIARTRDLVKRGRR